MKYLIPFLVFLFYACSNQDARVKGIQKELSMDFPDAYEFVQDDDVSHNGFESDYTQTISIQFKNEDIPSLIEQIESSPYYNQLEHLYGKSSSPQEYYGDIGNELYKVKDSLIRLERSGTWIFRYGEYVYMDFFDWKESSSATFDPKSGVLWFERNHL